MQSLPKETVTTADLELTSNGVTTKIHVKPSYPDKPKAVANLLKNLPMLLIDATMPMHAIVSFSTRGWDLDESADTIHRYVHLENTQDVPRLEADISTASEAEHHHPHIQVDNTRMTISCTTHVPAGLSMKDVKLAKRIDQILQGYSIIENDSSGMKEADLLTLRQRGRERNMEAVRLAKQNCNCG